MALTEKRIPYELLFRWNPDGKFAGAHVGFRNCIIKDGVIVADTLEPVISVAVAGNKGFPLKDVLSTAMVGIVESRDAMEAERDALIIELDNEKARANRLEIKIENLIQADKAAASA